MDVGSDASMTGASQALASIQLPQEGSSGIHLDLARSLRMHRGLAITVGMVALLFLIPLGLTRKPTYEASSIIYVQPVVSRTPTDPSAIYDSPRYETYIDQQLLTLHRPDILGSALDQLPAAVRSTFSPDRTAALKQLDSDLAITHMSGSYQITVTALGKNPYTPASIANAVTLAYLQNGQQDELALNRQQLDSLMRDREKIGDELEKNRKEQASLSTALGAADPTAEGGNPFDANLADLRTQVVEARNAHAVAAAKLASLSGKSEANPAAESAAREDPELAAVKTDFGSRRASLMREMNGLTPTNPLYRKDQAELDQLTQAADSISSQAVQKSSLNLLRGARLEAVRTKDIQDRLEAELARETATATSSTPSLQRAEDLAESVKVLRARYTDVDNAIHSLRLAQNPSFAAHSSLMASAPTSPLPSRKVAILALALPFAMLLSATAAIVRRKLDGRVYIGEDITRTVHLPTMAVLPESDEVDKDVRADFLFRLVAGLEQAHRIGGATTFVFTTSSQDTEIENIVSSVVSELGSLGYRTMTISAGEALSPVAAKSAKTPFNHQIADLATVNSNSSAIRTRREGIVDEHLERLRQQFDFLFIMAHPLLSSAETEFVVRLGDVAVLVVESGWTTRKELKSCLSVMRRIRARGVAVVVSDLKLRNADEEFIESVRLAGRKGTSTPSSKLRRETVVV